MDLADALTAFIITLMMEAVSTFVTSAIYDTTRHIPEDKLSSV
jgi:hypothetical protein